MPVQGHRISRSLFPAFIFTPLPEMRNNQQVGDTSTSAGHGLFKHDHSSRGGKKSSKKAQPCSCGDSPWVGSVASRPGAPLQPSPRAVQRENLLSPSLPLPPGDAFALTLLKSLIFLRRFDCSR